VVVLSLLGQSIDKECGAVVASKLIGFTNRFGDNGFTGDVCASSYDQFFAAALPVVDQACENLCRCLEASPPRTQARRMRLVTLGLLCASALAATLACARPPSSTTAASVELEASEPAAVSEPEPPPSPTPKPAPGQLPTSIPAHGVESLEIACEAIASITRQAYVASNSMAANDTYECSVDDGVLAEHGRAGLLQVYESFDNLNYHLPVIEGEAGWSVFPSALTTWDFGNEINVERVAVTFESWPSETFGELLVIDIAAMTSLWSPDGWVAEEHHWRKIVCAPGGDTPRCTKPIVYRAERYEPHKHSRKRAWRYEAELRLDGDALVVSGARPPQLQEVDPGVFLRSGRHSLEQLLRETEAWEP
jgi:hypothetical protein